MKSLKVVSVEIAVRDEGNIGKLKSCPFCGAEAKTYKLYKSLKLDVWLVGCDGKYGNLCPGYVWKCAPVYLSKESATRAWNRREGVQNRT